MNLLKHFTITGYFNLTWYISLLMGVSLIGLFVAPTVSADVVPHPSMRFTLEYAIDPAAIKNSQLIECDDAACMSGNPADDLHGTNGISSTNQLTTNPAYDRNPHWRQ